MIQIISSSHFDKYDEKPIKEYLIQVKKENRVTSLRVSEEDLEILYSYLKNIFYKEPVWKLLFQV